MDSSSNYSEKQTTTTFRDYLMILFRQKVLVFLTIVVVLITALAGLILKTPVYEAQVKMLISAQKLVEGPNYRELEDSINVEVSRTQSEIVTSTPVIKRTVIALNLDKRPLDYEKPYASAIKGKLIDLMIKLKNMKLRNNPTKENQARILSDAIDDLKKRIKVEPIPDTDMFTISVDDFDPNAAAATANVLARSYVIFDLEQQLADLSLKYGDKEPTVLQLQDNINEMISKLNGAPLSNIEAIGPATVKIIEQADVPLKPKGEGKTLILILSFFMSIFLGLMLAFIFDFMDPTFRSPQQIEFELNLPFLGSVPRRRLGEKLLIQANKANSRYTHFYQILCDQIYLLMKEKNLKTILITAAGSHEGTSTVLSNLGLYFSEGANHKVLLIDANFREASLHKLLKTQNTTGFANLIEGKAVLKDVLVEIDKNLHIITAGHTELNPVILLNSHKVKEVLEEVKKKFEVILIDCPNIMGFKESLTLAEDMDATIVVVNESVTRRHIAKLALQPLSAKKINLLGVVLNNRTFPIPRFIYNRI